MSIEVMTVAQISDVTFRRCMRYVTTVALVVIACTARAAVGGDADDPDTRAALVESQMTDQERLQLLHGIIAIPLRSLKGPPIPEGVPITAGYIKGIVRLRVPDILETDSSLGVVNPGQRRVGDVATAMPAGLVMAGTFDADLAFRGGAMIGSEARAKGFNVLLGGGVNLARDPRNGRNFEYLGEDPLLAGTLAGEAIRGTQTQGVVSTVKHFVLNDQETLRETLDTRIDESGLRESDLLAFELAIERGQPGAVMCSLNKWRGEHACGNDYLLNQILKRDWGYKGWVMSDWGAVHDVSYISNGLDQESGEQLDTQVWFDEPLSAQIAAGQVPKARISDAVRRILRSLYAVGADRTGSQAPIDYAAHAALARQVAEEGMVLLKNDRALPLRRGNLSIAVVGGHADIGVLTGGGSSQVSPYRGGLAAMTISATAGGSSQVPFIPSSPVTALRAALPKSTVTFSDGDDPEAAAVMAAKADIVIVFATQWQTEGADAPSMRLPGNQDELISALAKSNPCVIVVLETGNPVRMPWLGDVKGLLQAWYPGEEGGPAIADLLTGAVNPSGRLPITMPVSETQNPRPLLPGLGLPKSSELTVDYQEGSNIGYRWFAASSQKPLFPFGFGLSYTSFEFSGLKLARGSTLAARFTVKNTGPQAGAVVAQLYLVSAAGTRLQRLAAFRRVALAPRERQTVSVALDPRLLAHWDTAAHRWRIDAGRYVFALGPSAAELGKPAELDLPARTLDP
jgi:beta-glucosidase